MRKITSRVFVIIALFGTSFSAHSLNLNKDVEKSPNDKNEYAYFSLANNLQVFLISDKEADKAAASLDVKVGSSDDPSDYPGLAHFLEHMLFLGTEKFPEPDAYQKFISEHGGGHNAYTSLENTNYFFDVQADFLEQALDRFAQQFTAPLFNEEYVQREVNAVHSEYSSKIQDDGRRYMESLKAIMNPKHPYRTFSVGNLETLVDHEDKSLRSALLDFYKDQYSANRMRLTVLGQEDLETLAKWVEERFSSIPNKDLPVAQVTEPFFQGGYLPAKLEVENIMDTRSISLSFPIPSTREYIASQPASYLANLIGHEGKGSLLSALKQEQLVDTLSAGTQFDTGSHAMFIISMTLTQKGLKQQEKIIERVFEYINLIEQGGIKQLYFDEQAQLSQIAFTFREKVPALSLVRSLSSSLQLFAPKEVLSKGYKLEHFDAELIERFLSYLNPKNMLVSVRAQGLKTEQETQWFKAPYSAKPLSISLLNKLAKVQAKSPLALPEPNHFIPETTALITQAKNDAEQVKPVQLKAQEGIELWHASDTEFGTPKATFFLSMRSPYAMDSVDHLVKTQLLVNMLKDNLVEYSYPAYLAGLSYDLYKHVRGVTLKISGYDNKQSVLLETILDKIKTSTLHKERLEVIAERLKRGLENEKERKPFQQAIGKVQENLLIPSWSTEEKLEALSNIDIEDLRAFKTEFFSTLDLAILSNGNIKEEDARSMATFVAKKLLQDARLKNVERAKVRKLEGDHDWALELDIDHPDTSLVLYMQGESKTFEDRALYAILAQAIGNDYYAQLRTEKQLGYIVFASPYAMLEVPGLAFVVQSPSASKVELYDETKRFLKSRVETLSTLEEADFERYKQAVISRLEEKETNLGQRSNRYWSEIDKKNYDFNSKQQLIEAIAATSLEQLREFYARRVNEQGNNLIVISGPERESTKSEFNLEALLSKDQTATQQALKRLDSFKP